MLLIIEMENVQETRSADDWKQLGSDLFAVPEVLN